MYIAAEELNTHLNDESIEAISGDDETIITAAIDGAIAEVKGYLHNYDRTAIFQATGDDRNALLVIFAKDIAVWHYIALANAGIEYAKREKRYNAAVAWLKGVQAGEIVPDLPKPAPVEGQAGGYSWGSNPQRDNHI
jgi:phage gp36-like protein